MIPILIINRDRLTWPRQLARQCAALPGAAVTIIDNASTFGPLLDWYAENEFPQIRLSENRGPQCWRGMTKQLPSETDYFVITDGDLSIEGVPTDVLDVLRDSLDRDPKLLKSGLALRLDDLPDIPEADLARTREAEYWEDGFQDNAGRQWYRAAIATTFVMFRRRPPYAYYVPALRLAGEYQARHLPWYLDDEALSEEERYYLEHAVASGPYYTSRRRRRLQKAEAA
jgi:hypothetical protein